MMDRSISSISENASAQGQKKFLSAVFLVLCLNLSAITFELFEKNQERKGKYYVGGIESPRLSIRTVSVVNKSRWRQKRRRDAEFRGEREKKKETTLHDEGPSVNI